MKIISTVPILSFLSILFTCAISRCTAQNRFEFGASIDPFVIPINFSTYHESGPGYYDIHGEGKITQVFRLALKQHLVVGIISHIRLKSLDLLREHQRNNTF